MTRALLTATVAVVLAALLAAAPATADDHTPGPTPTHGTSLSPPSQQQIDDARSALDRLRQQGTKKDTTAPTLTQVAGPTDSGGRSVASRISDEAWWTIGAGLLVLLVASETTRLSIRRAKHRKGA